MISTNEFYEDMKKVLGELKESATYVINEFESENHSITPSLRKTVYYENYIGWKHTLQFIDLIENRMTDIYTRSMDWNELHSFIDSVYYERYGSTDEEVMEGILGEFDHGSL